jgi:RNA polymerase sigma-70 factor (ECF subfamily)
MEAAIESGYLKKLGEGDHNAFDVLFMSYHSLMKRFLLGFIKNEEDVEDMAQDIFYNIWKHRTTIATVDSFKAYLFRMARNAVYNYFKINAIREEHMRRYQWETILIDDLQEEQLYANDLDMLLDIAINNMPPQRQRIFNMSRKDGLSNEEISQQLNISKRTVENHITQALADLRKLLSVILPFFI